MIGALLSNIWSFADRGDSDSPDVNDFTANCFISYNSNKGWYVKTMPVSTTDWEASSDQRWMVTGQSLFVQRFEPARK